jgi:hypothetical protein
MPCFEVVSKNNDRQDAAFEEGKKSYGANAESKMRTNSYCQYNVKWEKKKPSESSRDRTHKEGNERKENVRSVF